MSVRRYLMFSLGASVSVLTVVGAFFIDFVNAVIITICLNIWS